MKSEQIIANYDELSDDKKVLLLICAITGHPQSRKELLECLKLAGIRHHSGNAFSQQRLKPLLEELEELGLLTLKGAVKCHPALDEHIMRRGFSHADFETYLEAVRLVHPLERSDNYMRWGRPYLNDENVMRELRIAVYTGDVDSYNDLLRYAHDYAYHKLPRSLLEKFCSNPFEPEWFDTLDNPFRVAALQEMILRSILYLRPSDLFFKYLEQRNRATLVDETADLLAQLYIVRGELDKAATLLAETTPGTTTVSKAMIALLRGDVQSALTLYRASLKEQRKASRRNRDFLIHYASALYPLALLSESQPDRLNELRKILNTNFTNQTALLDDRFTCIRIALDAIEATGQGSREFLHNIHSETRDVLSSFICGLVLFWFFKEELKQHHTELEKYFRKAGELGYRWLEMEFAFILHHSGFADPIAKQVALNAPTELRMVPLANLVKQTSPWERRLNALQLLGKKDSSTTAGQSDERLVYFVHYDEDEGLYLMPRLQKLTKKGAWTKGRSVGLARLANGELECMTTQDHAIARTIHRVSGYYGYEQLRMDDTAAVLAAAGHPLLFMSESIRQPVEIIRDSPSVHIRREEDGFAISLSAEPLENGLAVIREAGNRYRVLEFKDEHRRVAAILGGDTLLIPSQGEEKLRGILANLSGMVTVYSTLEGKGDTIESIEAENSIHGHLIPVKEGFRLEMLVKPVGKEGPYLKPGTGSPHVLATIDDRQIQAHRNLLDEKKTCEQILESCPSLQLDDDGTFIWELDEPQQCLQALLELGDISDLISLEWPEGQTMKIHSRLDLQNLSVRVEQQQDWFAFSGSAKLDNKTILQMHELLKLAEDSPPGFIRIKEGEFIALTNALQRRLDDLKGFSKNKAGAIEVHPAAAFSLEGFLDSVGSVQLDPGWKNHIKHLKSVDEMEFKVPSTLQTQLRDYQIQGFKWLARLAHLKFGACLADDMGLGKTIQALAVLLMRAQNGPALVVAPASVTFNWANEVRRFAPTLRVKQFSQSDRAELLAEIGSFDVLICSYGLLQSEIELLEGIEWETIVLDEAQAIKNAATKRSKAAMKLKGGFKLITTGTPLENHLGELWTLFNFINPGLLGSLRTFNSSYAVPITRFEDKGARKRLKRLLQPFILRRLKSEVLDELPPKTEIDLSVELTSEEAAFYEALRQKALQNISDIDAGSTDSRFRVFAELMRLRRACCHTRLVTPESKIASTKLNLFLELAKDLIENRHKVLVFSQFVDHLKLIESALKKYHISYQYLDGSTPTTQRKKRVEAFQAGEGDIFLISLRAGGTGLNLTAADYVVHMDPWWNPAVEDQASDRAHRIGQERPVTVYRFITKDTIEEKIIDLHSRKRDLADALLAETDSPERISVDDLVNLLKVR